MKRVLLLAESPYMGGITSHILSVAKAFRDHDRYRPVLATLPGRRGDDTLIEGAAALGHEVHVLPMAAPFDARVLGTLRGFLRRHDIDLVHTHNYRATLLAEAAGHAVARVNTCHGAVTDLSPRPRMWQWAELRVMRGRPLVLACSRHVRDWLASRGVSPARVRVIHNAFDPPEAPPEAAVAREALGIAADRLVCLYAGRLVPGKGLEHLVEALAGLPEAVGLLVGDGPLRADLEDRARRLGADLRFPGVQPAPWDYYRLADVAVLPSRMEALPMALIEAAAFAIPAVASRAGGIPEVVRDGETGLLVDYGDAASLRLALGRLVDPGFRRALGAAARGRWREAFSTERFVADLARAYDVVLHPGRPLT